MEKVKVKDGTKKGYTECNVGGVVDLAFPESKERRGRVVDGGETCGTLATDDLHGVILEKCRIRKLTPKECFRLQGFPDYMFERAEMINSDSQLYKQAGNSVSVSVIYEIAKRLTNENRTD